MENQMENEIEICGMTYFWLAANGGMEKKIETTTMGYIGTAIRIHSFIPS